MAEYIDREAMLEQIARREPLMIDNKMISIDALREFIMNRPIADVIPVIRCKDCAKDGLITCPMCWIENHTLEFINHDPNFYCGAAERK